MTVPDDFEIPLSDEVRRSLQSVAYTQRITPSPQPSVCSDLLLFSFNHLGSRQVVADFSAGYLSSDAGMLFLRQIDEGLGIFRSLAPLLSRCA
jgi:hypothetical protein